MKFLNKLKGKKRPAVSSDTGPPESGASGTMSSADLPDAHVEIDQISGDQAGQFIANLLTEAPAGGWHPVASLAVVCNQCNHPITLNFEHQATGDSIGFRINDTFRNLESALVCPECEQSDFRITNRKLNFEDWLKAVLSVLPPCIDDPAVGFRLTESGNLVRDHQFHRAESFDQLWTDTAAHINQNGTLKNNFTFNYLNIPGVGDKRISRTTGVAHQNSLTHELIVIIKDARPHYWYRIEKG